MGTSRPVTSSGAVDVQRHQADGPVGGRSGLVGARALVLVAEPWNFQSLHGRGRLLGRIGEARAFVLAGEELQFDITPQALLPDGATVSRLRTVALHGGAADLAGRLLRGESVGVRLYAEPRGGGRLLGAMRLQP